MSLPLYAKISIGVISVVLIATVALVVVTITTNKDKSPPKTPTMKEWMTSRDGVNTLTQALSSLDNTTTFGFNITGNAATATNSTNWNSSWESTVQKIKVDNASNSDNLGNQPKTHFVERGTTYNTKPCAQGGKKTEGTGTYVDGRWQNNWHGGGCSKNNGIIEIV